MSNDVVVVTSFSRAGYAQYGAEFLRSWDKYGESELCVFYEDSTPLSTKFEDTVTPIRWWFNLMKDQSLIDFLKTAPAEDKDKEIHWKANAGKFARKVFALNSQHIPRSTWRIWLDADTIATQPITDEWLLTLCVKPINYLGRQDAPTSECGFVAYKMDAAGALFLTRFKAVYQTGEYLSYPEWHDSYIFDRVMEEFEEPEKLFHNLSEGLRGLHVFDDSPIGARLQHKKGPLRKDANAMAKLATMPDYYLSNQELSRFGRVRA